MHTFITGLSNDETASGNSTGTREHMSGAFGAI
jgi:hypothetical protein